MLNQDQADAMSQSSDPSGKAISGRGSDSQASVRTGLTRKLWAVAERTSKPADHFKAVAIQEVAAAGEDAKFSLRGVVSKSGYGFSTFYKFWKGFDEYLLETYDFAAESFLKAEWELISQFSGETPAEYFQMLAEHSLSANQLVPRSLLRTILLGHLKGRVSRLLQHGQRQATQIADGFDRYFADQGLHVDRDRLCAVMQLHGTFLYWRKADTGLVQEPNVLIRLMIDSALMTVVSDAPPGSVVKGQNAPL